MRDLTLARSELARLSHTDQLTGLLNRRGFDAAAALALRSACATGVPAVIFMCDVDRFKSINDRFGHAFGDKVLVEIAGVLRAFSGKDGAIVGRHGGEEFAALMVGITHEQAAQYAENLRQACAAREILIDGNSTSVTISIGFTIARDEIRSFENHARGRPGPLHRQARRTQSGGPGRRALTGRGLSDTHR